jgi:hypothetical protein
MVRGTIVALGSRSGRSVLGAVGTVRDLSRRGLVLVLPATLDALGRAVLPPDLLKAAPPELLSHWRNAWSAARDAQAVIELPGSESWFDAVLLVRAGPTRPLPDLASLLRSFRGKPLVVAATGFLELPVEPGVLLDWLAAAMGEGSEALLLLVAQVGDLEALRSAADPDGNAAHSSRPAGRRKRDPGGIGVGRMAAAAALVPGLGGLATAGRLVSALSARRDSEASPTVTKQAILGGAALLAGAGLAAAALGAGRPAKTPAQPEPGLVQFRPAGETPISRLASLLLEELTGGPREQLLSEASSSASRGEPLARLEEWLYEQEDLARVIAGRFARFEIVRIAWLRFGLEIGPSEDAVVVARRILSGLGFSDQGDAPGLYSAFRQVVRYGESYSAGRIEPGMLGGALGPVLERVARSLLAFHLRVAFQSNGPGARLFPAVVRITSAAQDAYGWLAQGSGEWDGLSGPSCQGQQSSDCASASASTWVR